MNKFLKIVILIIGLALIIFLVFLNVKYIKEYNKQNAKTEEEQIIANLESTLIKYAMEIYPGRDGDASEDILISSTLNNMEARDKDISMFNTDKIKCDKEKTQLQLMINNNKWTYEPILECEFIK